MTTPTAPSSQPVAIVTGGASGIGRAMSEHLAGQGYRVAVMDVQELKPPTGNDDDDGSGSGGGTITTYGGVDVASWDAQMAVFQAVYARHGRIDVVCANAGISESGASSVLTTADAAATGEPVKPELKTLDVNLTGTIYSKCSSLSACFRYCRAPCVSVCVCVCVCGCVGSRRGGASR